MTVTVADLLSARRVAVIGASDDAGKIAGKPFAFLKRDGFDGQVWAVNPTRDTVQGHRSFPSVAAIGQAVDLAIITVPARHVAGAVRDCVEAGVRGAVIFAGGMAETGKTAAGWRPRSPPSPGTAVCGLSGRIAWG